MEKLDSKGGPVRLSRRDEVEGYVEEREGEERDGRCESERKDVCDERKYEKEDEREDGEVFEERSPSFYFDTSVEMDID